MSGANGAARGLEVKTLYRVNELAAMSGMPVRTLRRWLDARELSIRVGRSVIVPLVRFRDAFPEVWESIRIRNNLKRSSCTACGASVAP